MGLTLGSYAGARQTCPLLSTAHTKNWPIRWKACLCRSAGGSRRCGVFDHREADSCCQTIGNLMVLPRYEHSAPAVHLHHRNPVAEWTAAVWIVAKCAFVRPMSVSVRTLWNQELPSFLSLPGPIFRCFQAGLSTRSVFDAVMSKDTLELCRSDASVAWS